MPPTQNSGPGSTGRSAVTTAGAPGYLQSFSKGPLGGLHRQNTQELDLIGQWSNLNHNPLPGTSTARGHTLSSEKRSSAPSGQRAYPRSPRPSPPSHLVSGPHSLPLPGEDQVGLSSLPVAVKDGAQQGRWALHLLKAATTETAWWS